MKIPITFTYSQPAKAFWIWAKENEPRHRTLTVRYLPVKGHREKIKSGGNITFWKRLLDFLSDKGWPEYVIVWTNDDEMMIFTKYLLQDVKNEIQRKKIR